MSALSMLTPLSDPLYGSRAARTSPRGSRFAQARSRIILGPAHAQYRFVFARTGHVDTGKKIPVPLGPQFRLFQPGQGKQRILGLRREIPKHPRLPQRMARPPLAVFLLDRPPRRQIRVGV